MILGYRRGVHPWAVARFESARVARLATVTASGAPNVVPVVFVVVEDLLWTAVDAKPKSTRRLARLANIRANPAVSVLVDHYGEDWSTLWWVRAEGTAQVLETETSLAVTALAGKYPQYVLDPPLGPFIRVRLQSWSSWSAR
jgi:PPOX class probable F420-dependent enzyme